MAICRLLPKPLSAASNWHVSARLHTPIDRQSEAAPQRPRYLTAHEFSADTGIP